MASAPTVRTEDVSGSNNTACTLACGVLFFGFFALIGGFVALGFLAAPGVLKLIALFPLLFVAIGVGGIWAVLHHGRRSPESILALGLRRKHLGQPATDLPVPKLRTYMGKDLPVR